MDHTTTTLYEVNVHILANLDLSTTYHGTLIAVDLASNKSFVLEAGFALGNQVLIVTIENVLSCHIKVVAFVSSGLDLSTGLVSDVDHVLNHYALYMASKMMF